MVFKGRKVMAELYRTAEIERSSQCFKTLGFLELNYFNNYERTKEWFKTGMEIMDLECFFWIFSDCCAKEENLKVHRLPRKRKKLGSDQRQENNDKCLS
ncbi:ANM_HP_G0244310.mRNA.1.CDS.1 [Saccharomyces cerevisiae]|nr:ANM_HP_G0244310.mRNA.1.CDS.1 [Saccharomyces cerevisiae]CAI7003353.1 ANM_HP_G0244310.mRNA.1.CDS.1 [Saccharomyces cerevisiae]